MRLRGLTLLFCYLSVVCALFFGCASYDRFDTSTPSGLYQLAKQYSEDGLYEEALSHFADVRSRFPYTRFAVMAELATAEVHFEKGSYAEAIAQLEVFRELHPSHDRLDYVLYKIGMAHMEQMPSRFDRDLTEAQRAVDVFDEFLLSFPQSQYVQEVESSRKKCLSLLKERELFVARYYEKKQKWRGAYNRYLYVLKSFDEDKLGVGRQALKVAEKMGDPQAVSDLKAEISLMENRASGVNKGSSL